MEGNEKHLCRRLREVDIAVENQSEAVKLLDSLIRRHKAEGMTKILPDCNVFGSPSLNFLYVEIYNCCRNGQSILSLAGAGIFLEEFINSLWVSSQVHQNQRANGFNTWDEVMEFMGAKFADIENQTLDYKKDIRPVAEGFLGEDTLKDVEMLRELIRHTFVHSKRTYLIKILQQEGVLPQKMPVAKLNVATKEVTQVEFGMTHPLVSQIGFKKLADQLAPAMLLFMYEMLKKYHKYLAPLEDKKIGFTGHQCEYD